VSRCLGELWPLSVELSVHRGYLNVPFCKVVISPVLWFAGARRVERERESVDALPSIYISPRAQKRLYTSM